MITMSIFLVMLLMLNLIFMNTSHILSFLIFSESLTLMMCSLISLSFFFSAPPILILISVAACDISLALMCLTLLLRLSGSDSMKFSSISSC